VGAVEIESCATTAIVKATVYEPPVGSLAVSWKLNEPALVGVPESRPVAAFKLNPPGKVPLETLHE
jgi:hypothetical protein